MVSGVLGEIIAARREAVEAARAETPLKRLEALAVEAPRAMSLRGALEKGKGPRAIAELKKASPSKGLLAADFSVPGLVRAYERGGAAALSVLTEPRWFQGCLANLEEAKGLSVLPVLRKDFIVDGYQVVEARAAGADAILLIAAALTDGELGKLYGLAGELGMECLVEVHDEEELRRAGDAGCAIIGVNNRDLKTLRVDVETSLRLAEKYPDGVCRVSESGIRTVEDVRRLGEAGYRGILVGEALVTSGDPESALRALIS